MHTSVEESERPSEWLRCIREADRSAYRILVSESGGLAFAAYRLARARCRVASVGNAVPTLRELLAAAREIVTATADERGTVKASLLLGDCEHAGLPVIAPLGFAYA
jgi:hypothetical protein